MESDWDTAPSIPVRRIRCHKCGKEPTRLAEIWRSHVIRFEHANGKRGREGIMYEGNPYRVEAECDCGHKWRLRGVCQITALDRDDEQEVPDGQ